MKKGRFVATDLACLECGNVFTISRRENRLRSSGHIKDLWCPNCKKDRKFYELKDADTYYYKILYKQNRTKEEEYIFNLLDKRKEDIEYEKRRYIKNR